MIHGKTRNEERISVLKKFENSNECNTLLVSKIGDNSIDLPGANVIIQISSHFGSRKQEAQRLGRILRPKAKNLYSEFNAYFYSLVSQDTQEMWFADKRQQFLMDQGYAYRVEEAALESLNLKEYHFTAKEEQKKMLEKILQDKDDETKGEDNADDDDISKGVDRKTATMSESSIFQKYSIQGNPRTGQRHWFFQQRAKLLKKPK